MRSEDAVREGEPGFLSLVCLKCHAKFLRSKAEKYWHEADDAVCFECLIKVYFVGRAATALIIGFDHNSKIYLEPGVAIAPVWAAWISEMQLWLIGTGDGQMHAYKDPAGGRGIAWSVPKGKRS